MTNFEVEESKFQYKFAFNGYTKVIVSKNKLDEFIEKMDQDAVMCDGKKTIIFSRYPAQEYTEMLVALDGKKQSYKLWASERNKILNWYKSQR